MHLALADYHEPDNVRKGSRSIILRGLPYVDCIDLLTDNDDPFAHSAMLE